MKILINFIYNLRYKTMPEMPETVSGLFKSSKLTSKLLVIQLGVVFDLY